MPVWFECLLFTYTAETWNTSIMPKQMVETLYMNKRMCEYTSVLTQESCTEGDLLTLVQSTTIALEYFSYIL